jgi:hypothetical protein
MIRKWETMPETAMPEEELATSIEQVAEVLEQLKMEVRHQRPRDGGSTPLPGEPAPVVTRPETLEQVQATMRVNPHLPIAWPNWPKGLWPKIVALVQKLVRRLLSWYINPIVEQQNRNNAAVAQALDMLWGEVVQLRVQALRKQHQRDSKAE